MSIIADFLGTTFSFGGKIGEAEKAKKADNNSSNATNVNPNNVSYKDPIVDSFARSKESTEKMFNGMKTMFLVGFCLTTFPDILMLGIGLFLFAKHKDSFKNTLEELIKNSNEACSKLNQQVNAQQASAQPQQAQQSQQTQQTVQPAAQAKTVTNPQEAVKPAKQVKPLTPLEIAQMRYAKAEDKVLQYGVGLKKSEIAADEANRKLHKAEARMEKAKLALEKAKEEAKVTAEEKYEKASINFAKRYTEAGVAKERVDVAKAKFEDAKVKMEAANQVCEKMKAEEIVDVSAVHV